LKRMQNFYNFSWGHRLNWCSKRCVKSVAFLFSVSDQTGHLHSGLHGFLRHVHEHQWVLGYCLPESSQMTTKAQVQNPHIKERYMAVPLVQSRWEIKKGLMAHQSSFIAGKLKADALCDAFLRWLSSIGHTGKNRLAMVLRRWYCQQSLI
jgi:hypothetical protein